MKIWFLRRKIELLQFIEKIAMNCNLIQVYAYINRYTYDAIIQLGIATERK